MGRTENHEEQFFAEIIEANGKPCQKLDGAESSDGKVLGTYLHGVFDNSQWRRDLLNQIRQSKGLPPIDKVAIPYQEYKNQQYDQLADLLREHLDMEKIYQIINFKELES